LRKYLVLNMQEQPETLLSTHLSVLLFVLSSLEFLKNE
jgi:hypothetical protein